MSQTIYTDIPMTFRLDFGITMMNQNYMFSLKKKHFLTAFHKTVTNNFVEIWTGQRLLVFLRLASNLQFYRNYKNFIYKNRNAHKTVFQYRNRNELNFSSSYIFSYVRVYPAYIHTCTCRYITVYCVLTSIAPINSNCE